MFVTVTSTQRGRVGAKPNPNPTLHGTVSMKAFEYDIHPVIEGGE